MGLGDERHKGKGQVLFQFKCAAIHLQHNGDKDLQLPPSEKKGRRGDYPLHGGGEEEEEEAGCRGIKSGRRDEQHCLQISTRLAPLINLNARQQVIVIVNHNNNE